MQHCFMTVPRTRILIILFEISIRNLNCESTNNIIHYASTHRHSVPIFRGVKLVVCMISRAIDIKKVEVGFFLNVESICTL